MKVSQFTRLVSVSLAITLSVFIQPAHTSPILTDTRPTDAAPIPVPSLEPSPIPAVPSPSPLPSIPIPTSPAPPIAFAQNENKALNVFRDSIAFYLKAMNVDESDWCALPPPNSLFYFSHEPDALYLTRRSLS